MQRHTFRNWSHLFQRLMWENTSSVWKYSDRLIFLCRKADIIGKLQLRGVAAVCPSIAYVTLGWRVSSILGAFNSITSNQVRLKPVELKIDFRLWFCKHHIYYVAFKFEKLSTFSADVCFVPGECKDSIFIRETTSLTANGCLKFCQMVDGCEWFTFHAGIAAL